MGDGQQCFLPHSLQRSTAHTGGLRAATCKVSGTSQMCWNHFTVIQVTSLSQKPDLQPEICNRVTHIIIIIIIIVVARAAGVKSAVKRFKRAR